MKQKDYAWKVVRVLPDGKMNSTSYLYTEDNVEYKFDEWTYPKIHSNPFLFVFDTRKNARHFLNNVVCCKRAKVIKVLVQNVTKERKGKYRNPNGGVDPVLGLPRDFSAYTLGNITGTLFADAVMPIRA